jgi:hypothetical protein
VDATATAPALLTGLQRLAGNRAVAQLMRVPAPVAVQREPFGYRPPTASSHELHLDPKIEAQIRAIQAMNALIAPAPVHEGLREVNLNLAPMSPPTGPQAPAVLPPSAPGAPTRPVAAPGTGLMGPRAGTGGDIWQAVLAEPALGPAIESLGQQAAARARTDWGQLSTGGAVAVVTQSIVIGGGAIAGMLSAPDARKWVTAALADKVIPVPKVPGLGVQLNLSGNNLIVGLHLDVGKLLPASLGFGPASQNTPLGAPPNPYDPVQRLAAVDAPAPVVQREREAGMPTVQRDPIPGGVGGSTSAATGGAVGLQSIDGSFTLAAGKVLSSGWTRVVKTAESALVSVQIRSDKIVLTIANGIYIDAQWPCQNMRLYSVTHTFGSNETAADVRTVDDEWGDGMIDVTGTARSSIAETVGTIIAKTALDTKRQFPVAPALDTRGPLTGQGPPTPRGGASDLLPAYDPLADTNPQETLRALVTNLQAMPGGGSNVGAEDVSKVSFGATFVANRLFEKVENGTGLRIAAGTAVSVQLDSGASIPKLKEGAGQGTAAFAAAADIQALHLSSSGIEVVKDGKPIATINVLTISRGKVNIDSITLVGEAAEAADTERGVWVILGGLIGAAQSGVPGGFAIGAQDTMNEGKDRPVVVPGLVRGLLESKLQAAFTELLATQGRSVIPGVDIGSVLGVPGAPVNAQ